MVIAVAAGLTAGARIGVDAERIRTPSQDLLDGAFSESELALLPAGTAETESPRSEWVFRVWCAKEAVGKALGSGVSLDPRQFAITRVDLRSGLVTVRPPGGREASALTFRSGPHVLAIALLRTTH
jgi:phosphopantetheinyl transferase